MLFDRISIRENVFKCQTTNTHISRWCVKIHWTSVKCETKSVNLINKFWFRLIIQRERFVSKGRISAWIITELKTDKWITLKNFKIPRKTAKWVEHLKKFSFPRIYINIDDVVIFFWLNTFIKWNLKQSEIGKEKTLHKTKEVDVNLGWFANVYRICHTFRRWKMQQCAERKIPTN